ncbi:MAG: serine hydrolase [Chitinophagaceae bacterium]|nr:serine hydrolase [Chitinophagaceae bacterium]
MKNKYFLFLLLLVLHWQAIAQSKKEQFGQLMTTYHDYNMFDGAVLVAEHGKIIYQDAFGMANREWNIPNRLDTKFMIGSVSKPLTAMLVLVYVEKGLINLDKTLGDYLPEFNNRPAGIVTIRQILSHTSGMPNYDIMKNFFPEMSRRAFTREEYIKIYRDSALAFTPGTRYYYSSWGYFTLGYLVEKISGKTYAQAMKEEIFDKAGMSHSGSYHHTQVVPDRATGYDYVLGGYQSADFRDQSNTMGTGDIYSTVEDLFKFHLAIMDNRLIGKELTNEMLRPGIAPANYGFGWFNKPFKYTDRDSVATNFHLGMTEGFVSFFRRIPSTNSMVLILCNSSPTDFFGICNNLVKILYGQSVKVKQPIHKKMETLIAEKGTARAVEEFQLLKKDTARYYADRISLCFLAEQLLTMKRVEDARLMAENNIAEFPSFDMANCILGNVYLQLGRKEDAALYYRKTLTISPFYEEARSRLKEMGLAEQ